jgi:hypothetical protein
MTDLQKYKVHPNYKEGYPNSRDSVVSFVLREVAMVIAPPKEEGESHERRCEDIASAILTMESELVDRWNDRYKHYNKSDEPSNYGLPTQKMLNPKEKR